MGKLTNKFHRLVAAAGIAVSGVFEQNEIKSTNIEPITRKQSAGDEDIIGSEDAWKSQGKWDSSHYFDERMYKYTKLDDLVNFQNHPSGRFWKQIRCSTKVENKVTVCVLEGVRDDDELFSESSPIDYAGSTPHLWERVVDKLCIELNTNLA